MEVGKVIKRGVAFFFFRGEDLFIFYFYFFFPFHF